MQFITAAALAAILVTGQVPASVVMGDSTANVQVSSLIPDNVTVDQPVPLSEIGLPTSEYGTLSWADASSVPSERVQTYEVVFHPYNTADLAKISGWDGKSDAIYSNVTVVVSSISEDSDHESGEDTESESEKNTDETYSETENTAADTEEAQDDAEVKEEDTASSENTEVPAQTDETVAPEEKTAEEAPAEETPEITETPEVTEGAIEDTKTAEKEESPEITETPAAEEVQQEVTAVPTEEAKTEPTQTPEATVTPEADKDNIFDGTEKDISADDREQTAEDDLSDEEKAQQAEINHTSNGITVSGINLPWYVQFRVASGENYEFTNELEANVFKSYEFELWDLKNDTEYKIPDGEYLSVTVPVKAGYDYTIEHILDSGAMETIVPSVDGSTMVFSTHSFSPFGIAGSKALVGEKIEDGSYSAGTGSDTATTPEATVAAETTSSVDITQTPASSEDSDNSTNTTAESNGDASADETDASAAQENQEASSDQSEQDNSGNSVKAVRTGDNTPILPFVILGVAAVVIIGVLVYLRKKNK
ncbi:hypothetical protein [Blautia sp. MSJ-19]|uniref:hypothetical protein n=1 Tax=Blautia sp. MSJ-19 TaxID=2841517 RepID=UPI0020A13619|nr:hypothetical protein [Blautia sp. MSJ-19]